MVRHFFLALLLFLPSILEAQEEPEDLQFMIIEALSRNPEITAELSKMSAAEARIPQAGALDDAQLRFMKKEIPGFSTQQAMSTSLEFMQMVRFPTKLGVQSRIASLQAEHAHHEHLETVVSVIRRLKSAWAALWFARTAIEINREEQDILENIAAVATTQYAVGNVPQSEVLRAGIEFARTKADAAQWSQREATASSVLRALLDRSPSAAIGEVSLPPLTPISVPLEDLLLFALQNRPRLVHDSLSVTETSLMVSKAKQEYLPDLSFSVEFMDFAVPPRSRWTVSAGITLPFMPWTLGKASARVEESQAELSRTEALFRASKNRVIAEIHDAYARQSAAYTLAYAYEAELVPRARQSFQTTLSEYQSGRSSYLTLMDSYKTYQNVRMAAAMARMEYAQALADLEFQTGVIDLSAVPTRTQETKQ
ncbi:MAG: hypothetical protein HBSIN02_09840 [Bacteroidia bacterium]|nr:MAG: hypothetical protein HBSIN02_09840 [Bacteroidia bacterium]